MTYLLDINLLIALFDANHVHHEPAHQWFSTVGHSSWASCPLTENGVIRIMSNPKYPNFSVSPEEMASRLRSFCSLPGHQSWHDDISILDASIFDLAKLHGHQQITDLYLAGLALWHSGKLATFDESISTAPLLPHRSACVELVPAA